VNQFNDINRLGEREMWHIHRTRRVRVALRSAHHQSRTLVTVNSDDTIWRGFVGTLSAKAIWKLAQTDATTAAESLKWSPMSN